MDKATILTQLQAIVAENLGMDVEELSPQERLDADLLGDVDFTLSHIISQINRQFGTHLTLRGVLAQLHQDSGADEISLSLDDLADLIHEELEF
jgi:hypothetical protein